MAANTHKVFLSAAGPGAGPQVVIAFDPSMLTAAEVVVPLSREAGNSTGFRAQFLFFLDDLIPKLFD